MAGNKTPEGSCPDIVVYTNDYCPFCRRVYIALSELGLSYKKVYIDLDTPRPAWYLEINRVGKVPALEYNSTVVVESAEIVDYLVKRHASHLIQANGADIPRDAIDAFVHAFMSEGAQGDSGPSPGTLFHQALIVPDDSARAALVEQLAGNLRDNIEPRLQSADPYFHGSKELTQVEVLCGPLLLMMATIPNALGWHTWEAELSKQAPLFWRWMCAVAANPTVNAGWNIEEVIDRFHAKVANIRAAMQADQSKP